MLRVPAFFQFSIDPIGHLFDILDSGKRNYCFGNGKSLQLWIKKFCTNPVVKCSLNVVLFAVLFCRIPVNLYPAPFKVKLPFTTSIEDTETTVTMEMKTSAVKKRHAYFSTLNMEL